MKKLYFIVGRAPLVCLLVLLITAEVHAQTKDATPFSPPIVSPLIAPPLVREGAFAVKLATALGVGTTEDEVEAEDRLSELGILPRNGWMADYPVTPDIFGELNSSIGDAADLSKLTMNKDEALRRLQEVAAAGSLSISLSSGAKTVEAAPSDSGNFPDPSTVDDYYYNEGPPVVTYYAPPTDYSYLYAWVPYPFWWANAWFPGYFILRDFHRSVLINRRPVFVSNHYRDSRMNRFYRVDAVARFGGRTGFGTGPFRTAHIVAAGAPAGRGMSYSRPYASSMRSSGISGPFYRPTAATAPPYRGGWAIRSSYQGNGVASPSYRSAAVAPAPAAYRSAGGSVSYSHGAGSYSHSGGSYSHGGGATGMSGRGGGGGGGRGGSGGGGRGHR